jgi:hypothetical protein
MNRSSHHENLPPELEHLAGSGYLSQLRGLLSSLHQHHPHPNRELHYDELVLWFLLACFNPVLNSLRALQSASTFQGVRDRTQLPRFALGSFSEASHVFDPELLRNVFTQLAERVVAHNAPRRPQSLPPELVVLAADASVWALLPRMARAFYTQPLTRRRKGEFKGHFLFDVLRGVPTDVALAPEDERHVLPAQLAPHTLYVLDRGYFSSELYAQISAAQAFFVARTKNTLAYDLIEKRELTAEDRAAGVQRDELIRWYNQSLRLVVAERSSPPPTNLHPKRKNGKHRAASRASGSVQTWFLLTNRLDLSARDVVLLYAYRWHIETFFRWLKCVLKCQHFFSENENGFAIQLYATLIASLLTTLYTGLKPSRRIWEALCLYVSGWATLEDLHSLLSKYKVNSS